MRWALRLIADGAAGSLSALCIVRSAEGAWLAGRRAQWLASWAGRWALGAGGAVEVGENPGDTLARELREEWSVEPAAPARRGARASALRGGAARRSGVAGAPGRGSCPTASTTSFEWWPPDVTRWPDHADEPLRRIGLLLSGS